MIGVIGKLRVRWYRYTVSVRTVSVCRQRKSSADGRVQLDDTLEKKLYLAVW